MSADRINGDAHAFIWTEGTTRDLDLLPGAYSCIAAAINNGGHVVGYCNGYGLLQVFVRTAETGMTALGISGYTAQLASMPKITSSDLRQVATYAFVYRNGNLEDLGRGAAFGIDDQDQIVGWGEGAVLVWDEEGRTLSTVTVSATVGPSVRLAHRRRRIRKGRWQHADYERLADAGRLVPHVFHRNGKCVRNVRDAWLTACTAAGLPGRLVHDFRRSAVRNLERDGVSRSAAMAMVGHKTESIYRRYAIVDSGALRDAAAKIDQAAASLTSDAPTGKSQRV